MILCEITIAALIAFRAWMQRGHLPEKFQKSIRQAWLVLFAAAILGLLVGIRSQSEPLLFEGNQLKRNEAGEGSYTEELQLTVDGSAGEKNYSVDVPEYCLTKTEEKDCLKRAIEEIRQEFSGESKSINEIRGKVVIRDAYQNGLVDAEWSFANYDIMDFEGNVVAEEIPTEGICTYAYTKLSCGSSACEEEIPFCVLPEVKSEEAQMYSEIDRMLAKQAEQSGEHFLLLPEQVQGHAVSWSEKKTQQPVQILLLGTVFAVLMPFVEQSRRREEEKKRIREMKTEYSDIVSKLAILLSAGMTLQGAWKRIAYSYESKRMNNAKNEMPAYEEMLIACHELESGMGEERVYARFGERCKNAGYQKLGNILSQNLRKGTRDIIESLEQEADLAFEKRRHDAKRLGEEAATKLLLPMMLMMGMIMVILIIPAVISFQM